MFGTGGIEGNSVVDHDITGGDSTDLDNFIGQEGESVPIAVLIDIGGADVECWAESSKHCLSWPFELGKENVIGADRNTVGLESVDTDE